MNKKRRQPIQVKTVNDASDLKQTTKDQLLADSEKFDKENYNPLNNLSDKEVLINKLNKTDVITIRLTPNENQLISDLADENGLSKSAFVRMVVKKALKEHEYN
jgi:predicted DNA binding CopG/RHH family protein